MTSTLRRQIEQAAGDAAQRVEDAVASGQRLHLGASLHYSAGTSNKFYKALLVGRHVLIQFGRSGSSGETGSHSFDTEEQAAAKYWGLLRQKVGKGYLVVHSGVTSFSPHIVAGLDAGGRAWAAMDGAFSEWRIAEAAAGVWRSPMGAGPENRSPRTPKQGARVIMTLTSPDPDPTALVECAMAGESERFLHAMTLSHPRCPEEAQVARALAEMSAAL